MSCCQCLFIPLILVVGFFGSLCACACVCVEGGLACIEVVSLLIASHHVLARL